MKESKLVELSTLPTVANAGGVLATTFVGINQRLMKRIAICTATHFRLTHDLGAVDLRIDNSTSVLEQRSIGETA